MKKTLVAIVAIVLIVVLALGLFACNKQNGTGDNNNPTVDPSGDPTDNDPSGGSNDGEPATATAKVGDYHYTAPTAGTLTTAEVRGALDGITDAILSNFGEGDDTSIYDEMPELVNMITAVLNAAGVDKTFLDAQAAAYLALYQSKVDAIIDDANENGGFESFDALLSFLGKHLTADTISPVMTAARTTLSGLSTDTAVAVVLASMQYSFGTVYEEFDYDVDAINAILTAKGIDPAVLDSPYYYQVKELVCSDSAMYLFNVALEMVKQLFAYSPAELAEAAKISLKLVGQLVDSDEGIADLIGANGIGNVSFKDAIKVVNTLGGILEAMMSTVNDAEFAKALDVFLGDLFALMDASEIAETIKPLVKHPELLRSVATILKSLTWEQVSSVYADFSDWQTKMKTNDADKTFAVFVGGIVNLVKGEYSKWSTELKADLSTFLGNAELYKDVDALVALIPADKESISAADATKVVEKLNAIKNKIEDPFEFGQNVRPDDPNSNDDNAPRYSLRMGDARNDVGYWPMSADITKSQFFILLDKFDYKWYDREQYSSFTVRNPKVECSLEVETTDEGTFLKVVGDDVETARFLIGTTPSTAKVYKSNGLYDYLRIAKGTEQADLKTTLVSYLGSHMGVSGYDLYDSAAKTIKEFGFKPSQNDFNLSGFDTSVVGKSIAIITVYTPFGVCNMPVVYTVYDPDNLQVEYINVSVDERRIPVNGTEEDLGVYGWAYFDNGSSDRVDAETAGFVVSGFDSSKRGDYTIKATYGGKSDTTRYHVYDPQNLVDDELSVECTRRTAYTSEFTTEAELLALLGVKVYVIKDDGETREEVALSDCTHGAFPTEARDWSYDLAIKYKGMSDWFYYYVKDNSNWSAPHVYAYVEQYSISVGDDVDALGIYLYCYYAEDRWNSWRVYDGFTVDGFDSTQPGNHELTVTYQGETYDVTYYVSAE